MISALMGRLQLYGPTGFLPKPALVLGAIVSPLSDVWWFTRGELCNKLPG